MRGLGRAGNLYACLRKERTSNSGREEKRTRKILLLCSISLFVSIAAGQKRKDAGRHPLLSPPAFKTAHIA